MSRSSLVNLNGTPCLFEMSVCQFLVIVMASPPFHLEKAVILTEYVRSTRGEEKERVAFRTVAGAVVVVQSTLIENRFFSQWHRERQDLGFVT